MSFFLFILLIFAFFAGRFIWRVARAINAQRRQMDDFFEQMRNPFGSQAAPDDSPRERRAGWATTPRRRKRIDSSVGEYIEYEEIAGAAATDSGSQSAYTGVVEEQVSDAEWEEVK